MLGASQTHAPRQIAAHGVPGCCTRAAVMVFVGFGCLILLVAGLGYMLNKHEIDVRIFAIG